MRAAALLSAVVGLAGCIEPLEASWNGDPSTCDAVVEGACWRGTSPQEAERATAAAIAFWGPLPLGGWLVTVTTPEVVHDFCGSNAAAACAILNYYQEIWLPAEACGAPLFIHEAGHLLDKGHGDPRWLRVNSAIQTYCNGGNP